MHSTTCCSVRTGANMFASDLEFKTFSKEGWDVIRGSSWWELLVILFLCLGVSCGGIMHSRRYHDRPFKSSVWIWVTSEWILLRAVLCRTSSMESNFTLKEGSPPVCHSRSAMQCTCPQQDPVYLPPNSTSPSQDIAISENNKLDLIVFWDWSFLKFCELYAGCPKKTQNHHPASWLLREIRFKTP